MSANVGGRPNLGLSHVDRLSGSEHSKERLKTILKTIIGELSVADASALLGICPSRFAQLRESALSGALFALEPRSPGRPRRVERPDPETVHDLEDKVTALEKELVVNEVRAELATVLGPFANRAPPVSEDDADEQSQTAPAKGSRKGGRRRKAKRKRRRGAQG